MSSIPLQNIEGTGAEISEYAKQHPNERFRLIVLEGADHPKRLDRLSVDEMAARARQANREGNTRPFPE